MTDNNEHLPSQIGTLSVTESEDGFFKELFSWLLNPAHFPEPVPAGGRSTTAKKIRAYELLLKRAMSFMVLYPEDRKQLQGICSALKSKLQQIKEARGSVSYRAKDGSNSWYVRKGPRPAVAPRLLFAACIAKVLWPDKSPYDSIVEQLGSQHHHVERSAVERQVKRLLADPKKHPVFGRGDEDGDLIGLLRQELLEFKGWKEDQRSPTAEMSIEEFDSQFPAYLDRIHPTAAQVELLRLLLDNFYMRRKHRGKIRLTAPGMDLEP